MCMGLSSPQHQPGGDTCVVPNVNVDPSHTQMRRDFPGRWLKGGGRRKEYGEASARFLPSGLYKSGGKGCEADGGSVREVA